MATNKDSAALKTHKRPRGERTVNDDEVEEFFTILKRLQGLKNGAVRPATDRRPCRMTWRPEFTLDDFREVKDGHDQRESDDADQRDESSKREEEEEEERVREREREREREEVVVSRSFDLNAEPPES